jgi:hypothetical protein
MSINWLRSVQDNSNWADDSENAQKEPETSSPLDKDKSTASERPNIKPTKSKPTTQIQAIQTPQDDLSAFGSMYDEELEITEEERKSAVVTIGYGTIDMSHASNNSG